MNWTYDRDNEWAEDFPNTQCKTNENSRQSPINIDTSLIDSGDELRNINSCNLGCQLSINYKPSSCHVINEHNTPTVYFDSGSYISFNGHSGDDNYKINRTDIFELHKMTIHTPTMHSINSMKYDVEINLYHYSLGDMLQEITGDVIENNNSNLNSNNKSNIKKRDKSGTKISPEEGKRGVIISLLYRIGNDNGEVNHFLSQFINKIPLQASKPEDAKEINVPVDSDWSAEQLLPVNKAFFTYPGSLPVPPCEENWYWIVFEEIGQISKIFFETLRIGFKNNIRAVQNFNYDNRKISYNNNPNFNRHNKMEIKKMEKIIKNARNKIRKIKEEEKSKNQTKRTLSKAEKYYNSLFAPKKDKCEGSNNNNNNLEEKKALESSAWYVRHRDLARAVVLMIIFGLFILLSVKVANYSVTSDLLPKLISERTKLQQNKDAINNSINSLNNNE